MNQPVQIKLNLRKKMQSKVSYSFLLYEKDKQRLEEYAAARNLLLSDIFRTLLNDVLDGNLEILGEE